MYVLFSTVYTLWYFVTWFTFRQGLQSSSHSPMYLVFNQPTSTYNMQYEDGHIDSLKMLLYHEHFVKPYSEEHLLVHLLTSPM